MFLSVVVPTFNRKDSLRATLDALACQTYPAGQWEALVVSDGATDGTEAFVCGYASRAPFSLRLLTQDNSGPARARNRGIDAARGEVIVFTDDDVAPVPDWLAAHAAHHAQDPQIVVIGPLSPDPARRRAEPPWIAWEHAMLQKQYNGWRTGAWKTIGPNNFYSGNASVRREYLQAVGGFDEGFTRQEDVELAHQLVRACGVHFVYEDSADALHRPLRTFASWLAVPYAYGQLDVTRAQRGDAPWDAVRHGYRSRSVPTRALARLILAVPACAPPLRAALRSGAQVSHRLHALPASLAALSVLFNLRYLEGASAALGSPRDLRRVLFAPVPSSRGAA